MSTRQILFFVGLLFLMSGCATDKTMHKSITAQGDGEFNQADNAEISSEVLSVDEKIKSLINQGDLYANRNKLDEALLTYVEAYKLNNENSTTLKRLASIYQKKGNDDILLVTYKLLLEVNPKDENILENYGVLLLKNRQFKLAENAFSDLLTININNIEALNGMGVIYDLKKYYKKSFSFYNRLIQINKNDTRTLNNIGFSYYQQGQLDASEKVLQKVLLLKPSNSKAIFNMALLKAKSGFYRQAYNLFTKLENESQAANNVGYIAMMNNNHDIAEHYFNMAIEKSPSYYKKANNNLDQLKRLELNFKP